MSVSSPPLQHADMLHTRRDSKLDAQVKATCAGPVTADDGTLQVCLVATRAEQAVSAFDFACWACVCVYLPKCLCVCACSKDDHARHDQYAAADNSMKSMLPSRYYWGDTRATLLLL